MKKFITILLTVVAINAYSQTVLRQPNYNVKNTKSTNYLQLTPIISLSEIVNYLSGPGVTISNVKFNGDNNISIIGNMIGYFQLMAGLPSFGIDSGIIITSGNIMMALGPNNSISGSSIGTSTHYFDSTLLSLVPGHNIVESSVVEFDFTPLTDTIIVCKFIFGSEEYPEFVNSSFNDVFGFFINGPNPQGGMFVNHNLALIPGTNLPFTIDNVNDTTNSQYYINNTGGLILQYDGYTTPILIQQVVVPGQQYHFKIGVADVGDAAYDSGVLMKIKSFYGYASMPIANFNSTINGNSVTFNNTTSWAKYYVWNFGDGTSDTVYTNNTSITHIYNANGSYTVELEAHNYYQINKISQIIQIDNSQSIRNTKGNTFEIIPSHTENAYQLNINLNQSQDVIINITSISGQIISEFVVRGQKEINQLIDLSTFSQGVYILKVKTKENTFIKKVINR